MISTISLQNLRDNRHAYFIYQIYKWTLFFPLLGMFTLLNAAIALPIIWIFGQRAGQIGGIMWAKLNAAVTPMRVSVRGREKIDENQSYVVVANHQSQYDIFAIYGWLPVDFRWVLKQELRKVPVLGVYCEKAGHVYIDRSNTETALQSINRAKERITGGTSIFFFPEGTRSVSGKLLPFKKGAFKFAIDLSLPVLPVTIKGTRNVLPANTIDLFPGSAEIILHDPIPVEGYTDDNIHELMDRARNAISDGLK